MIFRDWVWPLFPTWIILSLVIPLVIWDAVWKGIALWRAGRNGHVTWFVCLFIFNTLGILPILYIFRFEQAIIVSVLDILG